MFSNFSFVAISILFLAQTALPVVANNFSATVVSIGDGDTIRVRTGNKTVTVRLACIDAPETKQSPWGQQSLARLKQLLPVGQTITLRSTETDKYKRLVAEVFVGNRNVNVNMVEEGQAVVYRQYLKNCPESKDSLLQGENRAKQQRLAFWSQANPVMPWDFRHRITQKSTSQPTQGQQQSNCDLSYPDFCIPKNSSNLNCRDITQRRFKVLPPDPHGFDRDRDGIGCER
ncbi:thermonuclease family protein [aff. Roholtiella sp. LEGE 12411]|uniref:thermonuclease family protein n=1 Tax=aff. Roholtiella sp. LEGE 12411 TaxID=1828822 RepID=UPI00187E5614|nr:thermonuclease family protein [aff. Roholtiella sp. LEGE 12411]MBE9038822.1 thermonuclease family protein [aff. Roholtiella sp. LEGE 12411]